MEASQDALVGQVLFKIAIDAESTKLVRSGELQMLEGILALALERIRAELEFRVARDGGVS
jgi:hypothetical protein